jgi:putative DNA methylase
MAISTFYELLSSVRDRVLDAAQKTDFGDDARPLAEDGRGRVAYADALATYLSFAINKGANYWSTICAWNTGAEKLVSTFGRQSIPMIWDYTEANPFCSSSGNFLLGVDQVAKNVDSAPKNVGSGYVNELNASKNTYPIRPIVISTDPPYYDNIGYGDISDFFYVWLRKYIGSIWPNLFRRINVPKDEELVAKPHLHGGRDAAEARFMDGMGEALISMRKASADDSPLAIYYAFKQSEVAQDGLTSAGWSSFLQGVVDSGLVIDGTWPMRMEYTTNLKSKMNVLASAVVLACRKRETNAATITRAEFTRALKREMPGLIGEIRKAGIGPVDMQQSVIGPGMGVFSRYAKVLEDDDSAMPVKTALSLINRVWEEIENELDTAFDAETQVALAWFATYGFDAKPSGELITLANAKNVPLATLFASDVFSDGRGKAGLTARADLPDNWSPATDKGLTVWECVQHTARVLNAEDGGGEAAARLVAEMGSKAADARALAYRLYEIASQKGWASEALIYNELAQEWPKLEDLASTASSRRAAAGAQPELF